MPILALVKASFEGADDRIQTHLNGAIAEVFYKAGVHKSIVRPIAIVGIDVDFVPARLEYVCSASSTLTLGPHVSSRFRVQQKFKAYDFLAPPDPAAIAALVARLTAALVGALKKQLPEILATQKNPYTLLPDPWRHQSP